MAAVLVLEDGRTFYGRPYGAVGQTFGEAVFSTGMSGYQETLTDPSYLGQVVVMTAPHIGNTGWNNEDDESNRIWVAGYVVRDPSRVTSSWRAERSLEDELKAQGVVGISDIDTRALTRHLRDKGSMRVGIWSSESDEPIDTDLVLAKVLEQPTMSGQNLVDQVTTKEAYIVEPDVEKRFRVAVLDLGIKRNTLREFAERGVESIVLPAWSSWDDIAALDVDGFFISNGPGDPSTADHQVELTRQALRAGITTFGICFGNQILARALGFETYKLKFGHRGINQPVLDRISGDIDITAHNHGFAVDIAHDRPSKSEFGEVSVSHICLNDNVVEGLELRKDQRVLAMSVQYHPEAAAGPHDAEYLFDRYINLLSENSQAGENLHA